LKLRKEITNISPAYDLVNTKMHVKDVELALKDRLVENNHSTKSYEAMGLYAYDDFYEFGLRIGILEKRVKKMLKEFAKPIEEIKPIIARSFLSSLMKERYKTCYLERLKFMKISFMKREV
jgi:serine/threonine-protein kinase HipA